MVNFICLKWGDKYGPEYVNRLYRSVKRYYAGHSSFYCYTDNGFSLDSEIEVRDISLLRREKYDCFTVEKLFLFDSSVTSGCCVLLDLDVLILDDLTSYLDEYGFSEPRFTLSHKPNQDYPTFANLFFQSGPNYVNSSFVTWRDDQLSWLREFFMDNREIIEYKYLDLDTAVFHTCRRKLKFHPQSVIYSYNAYREKLNSKIVYFNTSHGRGCELHEGPEWAKDLWTSHDSVSAP